MAPLYGPTRNFARLALFFQHLFGSCRDRNGRIVVTRPLHGVIRVTRLLYPFNDPPKQYRAMQEIAFVPGTILSVQTRFNQVRAASASRYDGYYAYRRRVPRVPRAFPETFATLVTASMGRPINTRRKRDLQRIRESFRSRSAQLSRKSFVTRTKTKSTISRFESRLIVPRGRLVQAGRLIFRFTCVIAARASLSFFFFLRKGCETREK